MYGVVRHNGLALYTSDAIDGRDDAYNMSGTAGRRITATGALTALNRRSMAEQIGQLGALNHFVSQPSWP